MKKKVYYKLNRYKVAKVEVESVEQEQAVKIAALNCCSILRRFIPLWRITNARAL